jgi:hypothetical protein
MCGEGYVTTHNATIAFRQWSDKGYIHCRVTIPIDICDRCNARYSSDPEIDKVLDEAFHREYEKR